MRSQIHATSPAATPIPAWTRNFVTATTDTDDNKTLTRYTSWRITIDTTFAQRYPSADEADVTIVADDQGHECACWGCAGADESPCTSIATNLICMGTPIADQTTMIDQATRLAAENGFKINGHWTTNTLGQTTAPLIPLILDPNCAAYEPATAAAMPTTEPTALVSATATALLGTEPHFFTAEQIETALNLWEENPDVGRDPSTAMRQEYAIQEGGTLDQAAAALYHARDLRR